MEQVVSLISAVQFPDLAAVTSLTIGDKSYTAAAATAMAELLLAKCPNVTHLSLADVIAGRMELEGLEILTTFSATCGASMPSLTHLDLSDNAMGLKGISACSPLFSASRKTLSSLSMCNDGLSHQSMCEVADLLTEAPAIQLSRIHFFNNMSGDVGCEHFKRILDSQTTKGKLTDMRFSGTRASSNGSVHIVDGLTAGLPLFAESLLHLDLNDNTFSTAGPALAAAFTNGLGKNLVTLNLGECSMGDDTVKTICRALAKTSAHQLTKLELGGNELTAQSMRALSSLLSKSPLLTALGLSENELSSSSIIELTPGLKTLTKLTKLGLDCTELGDRGGTALALLQPALSSLATLECDGNMFTVGVHMKLGAAFGDTLIELEDNDFDGKDDDDEENDEEIDDSDDGEDAAPDACVDELSAAIGNL